MTPVDVVTRLMDEQADHSTIIREAWFADLEDFWLGLSLATSGEYDFALQRVPALDPLDDQPGTLRFQDFYDVAMRLHYGELTGDAAKEAVDDLACMAEAKEWNLWYRRILLQSLGRHIPMKAIQEELLRLTTE